MTAGRPKGYPKSGGIRKGGVKTQTKAVKDAIKTVFYDRLGGEDYLEKIAKERPDLFFSLLAKLIPNEVRAEMDVRHSHRVDLGAAMKEAEERLKLVYSSD